MTCPGQAQAPAGQPGDFGHLPADIVVDAAEIQGQVTMSAVQPPRTAGSGR